jgi:hypothetical protein
VGLVVGQRRGTETDSATVGASPGTALGLRLLGALLDRLDEAAGDPAQP